MDVAEFMTSIQPSRETISKRMSMDWRNESNEYTVEPPMMPGLDHTWGARKPSESSTGVMAFSPKHAEKPEASVSVHENSRPEKMFNLDVSSS
jgi:hypothetical protein